MPVEIFGIPAIIFLIIGFIQGLKMKTKEKEE